MSSERDDRYYRDAIRAEIAAQVQERVDARREQERRALEDEERRLRQADEDRERRLHIGFLERAQEEEGRGRPWQGPWLVVETRKLTETVRLLVEEQVSIRRAAAGGKVTKYTVEVVKIAIAYRDLYPDGPGRLAFGPDTTNTAEGVRFPNRLPKRVRGQ